MTHPAPIRILVTDLDHAGRRVELRCGCQRVGRVITSWEPLEDTVTELLAQHDQMAPRCQHLRPLVGNRP